MKYDMSIKEQKSEAFRYFTSLSNKKCLVEIKKIIPNRSLRQNAYLHLLIGYFGVHFGYTAEEAKQRYKEINRSIYAYDKNSRVFWHSSSDLSVEDMTKSIDVFRQKSSENGCPLPPADDPGWLREIENEIEHNNYYL